MVTSQDAKIAATVDRIRLMIGRMRFQRPHARPYPILGDVDAICDLVAKSESFREIADKLGIPTCTVQYALIKFAAMHDGTKKEKKA